MRKALAETGVTQEMIDKINEGTPFNFNFSDFRTQGDLSRIANKIMQNQLGMDLATLPEFDPATVGEAIREGTLTQNLTGDIERFRGGTQQPFAGGIRTERQEFDPEAVPTTPEFQVSPEDVGRRPTVPPEGVGAPVETAVTEEVPGVSETITITKDGETKRVSSAAFEETFKNQGWARGEERAEEDAATVNLKRLGPTEFANLSREWAAQGITPQQIESQFIERRDGDIFLKPDIGITPTLPTSEQELEQQQQQQETEYNDSLAQYNSSLTADEFNNNPIESITKIIDDILESLKVPEADNLITEFVSERDALIEKRDNEIATINDNPWLSEGERSRRATNIQARYDKRADALTDRITLLNGQVDRAVQQAQWAATTGLGVYDRERRFNAENTRFLIEQETQRLTSAARLGLEERRVSLAEREERRGNFTRIGTNEYGDPIFGYPGTMPSSLPGLLGDGTGLTVTDASGSTYDIGTYATDPNHETRVQSILNNMGQMTSIEEMNNYIQSVASGSPVTGQMIANASEQYGVSWESMMAIMQQDSTFGTQGAGARSFNPGNVGNTETAIARGQLVNFGNWQSGVNAVAQNLAGRRVVVTQPPQPIQPTLDPFIQGLVDNVRNGEITAKQALDEIPSRDSQKRTEFLQALSSQSVGTEREDYLSTQKAIDVLNLKDHKGLDNAVGITGLFGRITLAPGQVDQKKQFVGLMEQVVSDLSLESLIQAKARGATFGALSDTEMKILRNAATAIGNWRVVKGEGEQSRVVGYDIGHQSFKDELDRISEKLLQATSEMRTI
ncbi:MAG: hypothetical protein CL489_03415, partial [Acidobacteria bacterium]|nr:hypothetical protein [Acidobacteriota bacterium]